MGDRKPTICGSENSNLSNPQRLVLRCRSGKLLFILMTGVMVEAEMYDTNNKRSLDMSELKKERCLNF